VSGIEKRRVVITGIGMASPIGHDLDTVSAALQNDRHGIRHISEFERIGELQTRLAGVVEGVNLTKRWPRQRTRSMGRVALLAAHATDAALADAQVRLDKATIRAPFAGVVNALDVALRRALRPFYPEIDQVSLIDYKVRIVDGHDATAARTRVLMVSSDGEEEWGTVGVSDSIIEASWIALVDALDRFLQREFEVA